MKTTPTPDTLRDIVERLEGAAHDLETALGLARRSAALPLHRDDIRIAPNDLDAAINQARAAIAAARGEVAP